MGFHIAQRRRYPATTAAPAAAMPEALLPAAGQVRVHFTEAVSVKPSLLVVCWASVAHLYSVVLPVAAMSQQVELVQVFSPSQAAVNSSARVAAEATAMVAAIRVNFI